MSLIQELKETLTLVLAGGEGGRLKPLTLTRAKPAVPFGGAYRIIDFTLSNCIHSGLRRVFVLTQYQALSLEEHIRFAWNFLPRRLEQFISVRPPHHRQNSKWYRGTADAIAHNLETLHEEHPKHVLILSGDHIYKMDYGEMLRKHVETGAALTIGSVQIPQEQSSNFGIFECDSDNRVLSFKEKPETGPEIPGKPGYCLASMGIYIFETEELIKRLRDDMEDENSGHDFGHDVIPSMIGDAALFAYPFTDRNGGQPYWRDVGTLDTYFESNLDLCSAVPEFNLYDETWPTYTLWHNDPPAKTISDHDEERRALVVDSLLCPGVIVSGARCRRSILSNRVRLDRDASVEDSILMSGVQVGAGAKIRRAIIDKWVQIPEGAEIGYDRDADEERFHVSPSGIVVVPLGYEFD
ncbi:MAG: glucose-1-phosphate adenylyltransferase [Planctomycetota bacterium]|jgi:glucose-1-phosphate adenylyltransferase